MYDNQQLIDTLIVDCNNAVGAMTQGQYILFCRIMYEMVQKLGNLKKGVKDDLENREAIIKELQAQLGITEVPVGQLIAGEAHEHNNQKTVAG